MSASEPPPVAIVGFLGAESFGSAAGMALRDADVVLGAPRLLGVLPDDAGGKRDRKSVV